MVLVKDSAPAVKLDDKYYKLVDKLEALTLRAPSLIDATSLTVKGPLKFVPGIKIVGDVTFVNGTVITVDQCVRECIRVTTIVTCLDDGIWLLCTASVLCLDCKSGSDSFRPLPVLINKSGQFCFEMVFSSGCASTLVLQLGSCTQTGFLPQISALVHRSCSQFCLKMGDERRIACWREGV